MPNHHPSSTVIDFNFAKRQDQIADLMTSALANAAPEVGEPEFTASSKPQPMLEAALAYAAMGWWVFPVPPGTKKSYKSARHSPGKTNWGATFNPKLIRRDFAKWPDANVGIVTGQTPFQLQRDGEPSGGDWGIFVVEADTAEGHNVDGIASLRELEAKHGPLPETRTAISPSGSVHRYYKHPGAGIKVWNSESFLAPGVDVRGDGGMVLAPPSIKPGIGTYRWLNEGEVAEAPAWLLAAVQLRPAEEKKKEKQASDDLYDNQDDVQVTAAPDDDNTATDWQSLFDRIRDGHKLHDSLLSLAAKLITSGMAAGAAVNLLRAAMNGSSAPHDARWQARYDDIPRLVNGAEQKTDQQPVASIIAEPYIWTEPQDIPPRDWLYGNRLIRKFVTATIAPGALGKSTLEITEALAMVSGKALLGVQPSELLRVWLWNLEDPRAETVRRVQATAKHYRLKRDDLDGLFLNCGREQPLVIAETNRHGVLICRPIVETLIAQIRQHKIDVAIVDPFISSHRIPENDNNAIDAVIKEWGRVADATNCGIELVHHVRKGEQEVKAESARGGGSFGDGCRMVRVVNRMTKDEATTAGVTDNHRLYFRAYVDKNNLAPPADVSDWFKLISVDLHNGPLGPTLPGDSVGVVTAWTYPKALDGMTGADFDKVSAVIRSGEWRKDSQAANWVGYAIGKALGLDLINPAAKAKVRRLLKTWLGTGSLVVVKRLDPFRKPKDFVEVADDE
ncbi:Bifunctional DNA primase/polymerase, N-terminal [Bradyrhizobium sp. Ghvi]|uniref:AAA family ATPase n=1 Tax=Bradyrhizobium sp. Ghvi TaxID=1855319 RepID=UPI0008F35363|nr:AAA family ATPase [Bradyrhizobium sp. Ghvi]SFP94880.1 Bifunctional DNA primase/polymerase, N-terminal [Bradyrhizobium sp. Ghvi]